jgi:hypothetical protein
MKFIITVQISWRVTTFTQIAFVNITIITKFNWTGSAGPYNTNMYRNSYSLTCKVVPHIVPVPQGTSLSPTLARKHITCFHAPQDVHERGSSYTLRMHMPPLIRNKIIKS